MPSEYEIYRAYAGLNKPQSKLDYFLQGVGKLQGIAESNKRLELQERRLELEDERANERLELAQTQEERIRETTEFNKQQALENKEFQRSMQTWNSITDFSSQLPLGQRYKFMSKQAGSLMSDEFMESEGLNDRLDEFKTLEEEGLAKDDMHWALSIEDSPEKIKRALDMNIFTDNAKKRVLHKRMKSLEKQYAEHKPFDIDLLTSSQKGLYNAYNSKLNELYKKQIDDKLSGKKVDIGGISTTESIRKLEQDIAPLKALGATAPIPVFTASTESLKAVGEDDDLMRAFFADESNNLDEFIQARGGAPKPEEVIEKEEVETGEVELKGSIWEPTTTTISVAGGPGGEQRQSEYPTYKLKEDIPEMYKDEKMRGQAMSKMTQDIREYNSNISKIDENLAQIDSSMKGLTGASLERVKAYREKITIKKQNLEKELKDMQSRYDYLKEPEPEIVVK